MKRSGAIFLLVFVLFIAFLYWQFILNSPCQPVTQCRIISTNMTCASDTDCFSDLGYGTCNTNTFKCVNMVMDLNNEEICLNAGGKWSKVGC